jgi:tRNA1Val (adenine37-N6)-methyltransferase
VLQVERLPMETVDTLQAYDLQLPQARDGYRFSLDPLLLCDFAEIGSDLRVVDLGTGSGIIPQLLARMGKGRELLGVELQESLAERARRSVALNGLSAQVRIEVGDIRALPREWAGSFDVALSNPPYRSPGRGRLAPGSERAMARFELAGGLEEFLRAAALLLRSSGRFYVIYLAERLAELLAGMRQSRLEPKRLRLVHARAGASARLVLVEGRKDGRPGMTIDAPLIVFREEAGREYTEEMARIFGARGA